MDAADAFGSAEPELRASLDAWAAATPASFAPYLARAAYWRATAHAQRGAKWVRDTPDEDLAAMKDPATLGLADAARALSLRPRLVAARRLQIQLGLLASSRAARREAIDGALAACPSCFQVRVTYLFSLTPRWGGTYDEMDSVARAATDLAHPRLRLLGGYADHDRARLLLGEKRLDEARAAIDRATALGDHWEFLVERARIAVARGDVDAAVADLDRAAALRPGLPDILFERAWGRMSQRRWEAAGLDLLAALRAAPTDATGRKMHRTVVDGLVFAAGEAHRAGRRDEALRVIDLAAELSPTDPNVQSRKASIVSGDRASAPAGELPPLEQAVRDRPDDFRAHQQLDHAWARQGQLDRVVAMWSDYLARHPGDGPAHLERGGAYFHQRKLAEAHADASRACDLGVSEGCARKQQLAPKLGR
jgi:tetratricopeptide (TPR) repeat protein